MNCKKCGSILTANDQFCKGCGTPVSVASVTNPGVNQTLNSSVSTPQNSMNYQTHTTNNAGMGQASSQPLYNNSYNTQPNYNKIPQQKNNNILFIILGVVIVVAIFAAILIVGMLNNKDKNGNLTENNNPEINQTENSSTYKVILDGFELKIPDNLVFEEDDEGLMIGDEDGTWVAQLIISQGSFAQLKTNKNQLQSLLQQQGMTSSAAQLKTLKNVEFITMEVTSSGQNAIMAMAKANSMYFVAITAFDIDNEFNYTILETVAPIISSISISDKTSNMEIGTNINFDSISELAK